MELVIQIDEVVQQSDGDGDADAEQEICEAYNDDAVVNVGGELLRLLAAEVTRAREQVQGAKPRVRGHTYACDLCPFRAFHGRIDRLSTHLRLYQSAKYQHVCSGTEQSS